MSLLVVRLFLAQVAIMVLLQVHMVMFDVQVGGTSATTSHTKPLRSAASGTRVLLSYFIRVGTAVVFEEERAGSGAKCR